MQAAGTYLGIFTRTDPERADLTTTVCSKNSQNMTDSAP